ncbi:MAG TPA: hypothetical protein VF234_04905 [Limnochordia bacterium]
MSEPLTDERLAALEAEWSDAWDGLDDTPMMPTSEADPAYGSREHRMIASAPRTIRALIAEVRALRRVAEAAGAAERAWSTFNRQREMTADMSAQFDLVPTQEWWSLRTALAEWRRVRGE